jgi:hypothetical protein
VQSSFPSPEDAAQLPAVREFTSWLRLGVHLPIPLLGVADEAVVAGGPLKITNVAERVTAGEQPAYVGRDCDAELRALLSSAVVEPNPPVRLVVVGGESGSGKTRTAVQAMRAELPDWRLLIPDGVAALRQYSNLARTVVWLDEMWWLLGDRDGLRGGAWVLLDQRAQWIRLTRALSDTELARAKKLDDPWVIEATERTAYGFGFAEWLAAGPLLQQRLDLARLSPNLVARAGAALVDGAVQCTRAGYDTPLPLPLLAEAHGLYYLVPPPLDSLEESEIPQLDDVIGWARQPVVGTMGLLRQRPLRGDEVADYLVGYSQISSEPIDARLWPILLRHLTPRTLLEVGLAAARQHDNHVITRELARRADRMDDETYAAAELYAALGDEVELERCAALGESRASELLAQLLHDRGDEVALARRAEAGDGWAATMLGRLRGEEGGQAEFLRQADVRMRAWEERRALLMSDPQAEAELTRQVDAGDTSAAMELAQLFKDRGDEAALVRRADAGDIPAKARLAEFLLERGDEAELARRADAGDYWAADRLAELLVERGDQAQLAIRAATRDEAAADRLLDLYEERGDEIELRRLALFGIIEAIEPLAKLRAARTSTS